MQRVVEISDRAVHLALLRGFVVLREGGEEIARLPLDDLACLVLSGRQASLSAAVMHALMERGIPVIVTGANYHPSGIMLPVVGHYACKQRLDWQIAATEPFKKRLWQCLVKAKITHQAIVLHRRVGNDHGLAAMVAQVGSGDPQNRESQAARLYWPRLLGADFRRHADDTVNAALNYGYAILRACVARNLVACGLQPALGIHHDNQENPFCLADDILEPFRPYVDDLIFELANTRPESLSPDIKKDLAGLLAKPVTISNESSILSNAILTCCQSLARAFESKEPAVILPQFDEN